MVLLSAGCLGAEELQLLLPHCVKAQRLCELLLFSLFGLLSPHCVKAQRLFLLFLFCLFSLLPHCVKTQRLCWLVCLFVPFSCLTVLRHSGVVCCFSSFAIHCLTVLKHSGWLPCQILPSPLLKGNMDPLLRLMNQVHWKALEVTLCTFDEISEIWFDDKDINQTLTLVSLERLWSREC